MAVVGLKLHHRDTELLKFVALKGGEALGSQVLPAIRVTACHWERSVPDPYAPVKRVTSLWPIQKIVHDPLPDIAGQDISAHGNDPAQVVRLVRNWLRTVSKNTAISGAAKIQARLALFERELPDLCAAVDLDPKEIPFADLTNLIFEWLKSHPLAGPGTGK